MKQIIYLGGKKAREYDGVDKPVWKGKTYMGLPYITGEARWQSFKESEKEYYKHISTLPVFDVIGDCDWKEGEVKTEGVDYFEHPWGINAIVTPVPIPKKQEGEEELWNDAFAAAPGSRFLHPITKEWFKNNFTITRKS